MTRRFQKRCFISAILLTMAMLSSGPQPGIAGDTRTESPPVDLTEMSLENLMEIKIATVYGASKYEQKVTEAPSSVSIIMADDIKKYGYRTLADLLRSVRSFYIINDRNYSYAGVRGFGRPGDYNSRILLLVDGHRTNDNIYDSAFIGTEGIIDADLIDRVEVIRGPGSSLYGSNAFFAVVNIITRRGRDVQGVEASGEAASYTTYKGRVSYGKQYQNGLDMIVSGTGYDSKGQDLYYRELDPAFSTDPRATNSGVAEHADYDRFNSFFTKASYRDMIFTGAYSSRTKGIPTGAYGVDYNVAGNKTTDARGYGDIKYEHGIGSQTDLTARVYYDSYAYTGDYLYSGVLNKDEAYGSWWGGELRLTTHVFDVHRIVAGAEYQDNLRQDQRNYDEAPYASYLDDKRASRRTACYAQDEIALTKHVIANVGARYDHYDTFGGTMNPRLAVIYNPLSTSSIKFLYGTAFRAPNVFEQYYSALTSVPPEVANPDLKPEKIATYELVYEQYIGESFRGTAEGFYYEIKDLINLTTNTAGDLQYENIAGSRTKGFELELEKKWTNGVNGRISYSIQRSIDTTTGEILTNSPEQLAKLNITVPIVSSRVFAGIEEQYTSRRKTVQGNYASEFFITNVTLFSRQLIDRLELSVSVYNLFDKRYGDPVSDEHPQDIIEQDGRNYRAKLTYRF